MRMRSDEAIRHGESKGAHRSHEGHRPVRYIIVHGSACAPLQGIRFEFAQLLEARGGHEKNQREGGKERVSRVNLAEIKRKKRMIQLAQNN